SFLPIVPFRFGQIANQVGQRPLVVGQPLGVTGLLGCQLLISAAELVERFGSLVDLLLKRLEHLELGGRWNSVAASGPTASASATTTTALSCLLGVVGLERVNELIEAVRGRANGLLGLVVGLHGLEPPGGYLHTLRRPLEREREHRSSLELFDQPAGLVLEAPLDLAQAADAGALGDGQLAVGLATHVLIALGGARQLGMAIGQRLELIAHPGELFHGQPLLGLLAVVLELFLGIVQVGQGFFLVLVGLVSLVLVQLLLSLAHLARGIGGSSTGAIGTQLGEPLQLPLELLLDLRLVLCQLLELVAPFLSIGVLFGVAGGLEVLGLSFAQVAHLGLGLFQLLHQARKLAFAAVLNGIDKFPQFLAGLILLDPGLTHLVFLKLLGGFTHLGAGALLAAVARRLTHGGSGQRV